MEQPLNEQHVIAALIDVLKQLVPRQIPATPDNGGEPPVLQVERVQLTGLASKLKTKLGTVNLHVTVPHRSKSEGLVLPRVLLVSDPYMGQIHEARHRGQHLFLRQTGQRKV